MGKTSRRRSAAASSAIIMVVSSAPFVASLGCSDSTAAPSLDSTASPGGSSSSEIPPPSHSSRHHHPLTTVFSCGSQWRQAQSCTALCINGDDSYCPDGQYCYAGIPCTEGGEGDSSSSSIMEQMLERQARLELREMDRLRRERGEEYVERFVCGRSFGEAEESCNAIPPSSSSFVIDRSSASFVSLAGSLLSSTDGVAGAHYCPSGSSSACPTNMECYAAVPCPQSHHAEEVSVIEEISLQVVNVLVTEPILLNDTTAATAAAASLAEDCNDTRRRDNNVWRDDDGLILSEDWRTYFRESSSILSGTVSALLSSRHVGLN